MRWSRRVACKVEMRTAQKTPAGKPEEKIPHVKTG